jgi:hypothetical protein
MIIICTEKSREKNRERITALANCFQSLARKLGLISCVITVTSTLKNLRKPRVEATSMCVEVSSTYLVETTTHVLETPTHVQETLRCVVAASTSVEVVKTEGVMLSLQVLILSIPVFTLPGRSVVLSLQHITPLQHIIIP